MTSQTKTTRSAKLGFGALALSSFNLGLNNAAMDKPAAWTELWRGGQFGQFALLILGVWLNAADSLVTVTVMPSVAQQIGGYAYFGWATAVFLIGAIVAGASAGAAVLRVGLRRAMVAAGAAYAVGCAIDASAPEITSFLVGRLVQGLGAGWIIGLSFVAVGAVFPERLWARVFASITGVWGVATLIGPLVGGLFANAGLWRWAFWFFAIQGVGFCLAAARLLPPQAKTGGAAGLPWRQLLMVAAGVLAIGTAGVVSMPALGAALTVVGLGLLVWMLRIDASATSPMLPRETRNLRSAAGAGYLTIFLLQGGTIVWSVYGAAFVQSVYGSNPLVSGYVVSCEAVGWTVSALLVANLAPRWHGLFIRLGAAAIVLGIAGLAACLGRSGIGTVALCSAFIGAGFGLTWAFLQRRILASLPETERSLGSSAIPTAQMIGSAAGAAGASAIGDLLGLARGVARAEVLRAAPILFIAFLPVAIAGAVAADRLARLAPDRQPL